MVKSILCFGDSNTWGADPESGARYAFAERWPGVLQKNLGSGYRIIEEGLCGRSTAFDDPLEAGRNGLAFLPVILETHAPLDFLIIMLGTNDLKARFGLTAEQIAQGAGCLVKLAKDFEPKVGKVILVSPACVVATADAETAETFAGAIEKSAKLAACYRKVADDLSCEFFDAAGVIQSSTVDGIHLDRESHQRLGEAFARVIC